jgi:hypothetical protein
MPSLHSPVVAMTVPSESIWAWAKKLAGCRFQTFKRVSS